METCQYCGEKFVDATRLALHRQEKNRWSATGELAQPRAEEVRCKTPAEMTAEHWPHAGGVWGAREDDEKDDENA